MRTVLTLLLALSLAACQPPPEPPKEPAHSGPPKFLALKWKPDTVRIPERSTTRARLIYKGDLDPVVAGGNARVLGTLLVAFPATGEADVWLEKILRSSAKRGGTHAMVVFDELVEKVEVSVDEGQLQAQQASDAMRYFFAGMKGKKEVERQELLDAIRGPRSTPMKTTRSERRVVGVVVIHVPMADWEKIPADLRPTPQNSTGTDD